MKLLGIFDHLIPLGPIPSSSTSSSSKSVSLANVTVTDLSSQSNMAEGNRLTLEADGTDPIVGTSGTYKLPLYGVAAQYGASGPTAPSIIPIRALAPIKFNIPSAEMGRLAVYWMNLGYDNRGITVLAPNGWEPSEAIVGANGSLGITLSSGGSRTGRQSVTFGTEWNGNAIQGIGTYFPKLRPWARNHIAYSYPGMFAQPKGMKSVYLNDRTLAYSLPSSSLSNFQTNGVVVAKTSSPPFLGTGSVTSPDIELSRTVLNFLLEYTMRQV